MDGLEVQLSVTPKGALRREALIEAATRLFLARGFESTTLDLIVAEGGGSRREIYRFFGGKEELFESVVESVCDEILSFLDDTDFSGQTPAEALTTIGRAYLSTLLHPRTLALYRAVMSEAPRAPRVAKLFFRAGPKETKRRLSAYLAQCRRQGLLEIPDSDFAASQFVGLITADLHIRAALDPAYRPTQQEQERNVAAAVEMFEARFRPSAQ